MNRRLMCEIETDVANFSMVAFCGMERRQKEAEEK